MAKTLNGKQRAALEMLTSGKGYDFKYIAETIERNNCLTKKSLMLLVVGVDIVCPPYRLKTQFLILDSCSADRIESSDNAPK